MYKVSYENHQFIIVDPENKVDVYQGGNLVNSYSNNDPNIIIQKEFLRLLLEIAYIRGMGYQMVKDLKEMKERFNL